MTMNAAATASATAIDTEAWWMWHVSAGQKSVNASTKNPPLAATIQQTRLTVSSTALNTKSHLARGGCAPPKVAADPAK